MALCTIKKVADLETGFVLAPERYDPRRETVFSEDEAATVALSELVTLVKKTVNASSKEIESCLVLDTSDSREGIVIGRQRQIPIAELGSTKKVLEPNDVIVSRLRPYLRQVALVDKEISNWTGSAALLCSTEYFPLRSIDGRSIAFLVPFLLSDQVQKILAASQEGGHHPRFNDSTLLALRVPKALVQEREAISKAIEQSVRLYRESERLIEANVNQATALQAALMLESAFEQTPI